MKKPITDRLKAFFLAVLFILPGVAGAQVENFEISVRNLVQTATNKLEFDVYLLDTDPGQDFELASCQLGMVFNNLIYTGGTITVAYDNTGSGLNGAQQFSATVNYATNVGDSTVIKLAGKSPPGSGSGTMISKTGFGTLLTHFIITNTIDFVSNSTPDIAFCASNASNPLYATKVSEYISAVNTALAVAPGTNAIVYGNPLLNPPASAPTAFNVTGGGSYCEGTSGLPVGLNGSETGVTYTLYKNTVDQVPTVDGNGSAISFGNQTAGTYIVKGTNTGGTTDMTGSAVITEDPLPLQPGAFTTYTSTVCQGVSDVAYTVPNDPTVTYNWSYSGTGASITGSTNSVTVSYSASATSGNLSVTATNGCGTSTARTIAITVNPGTPAAPGTITGTSVQCPGLTDQVYSISAVPKATTYSWDVPTGWTITTGDGTTSITVTTGSAGQNGNITVTASNSCGTSTPGSLAVTVNPGTPATPGAISGKTAQCPGSTGQVYSITSVQNATTYNWTAPTGWSITSGQGSVSITVTAGSTGQDGNITVSAGNGCGTSAPATLAVTVSPGAPATPGAISGPATQCPGQTGQVYSISSVADASYYTWTVPSGWSISSGQGSATITVTTGSAGQNGNILVLAGNGCGESSVRSLAVTVITAPATPGAISGDPTQCPGLSEQIYSISPVTNATTYTWTVPTGWAITAGQNTTSITVTTGSAGQNGNISVSAGNSCGTSTPSNMGVTVSPGTPASPGLISGTTEQCPGVTGQSYSINAVPNATTYNWTVPTGWLITAGQSTTSITVTTGSAGQNGNITVTAGNSCGTSSGTSLTVSVMSLSVAPTGVSIANNNTCYGSAKTLTVTGGSLGAGASWQWYTGSCGGTLAGTGSSIIVDPPAGSSTTYYVLATGSCNTTACASGTVVVSPTVGTPSTPVPSASTICQGTANTTFTASAANAISYNWTVSGSGNIISGTGTTGTVTWSPSFSDVATISVTANGCGGPSASASTTATVRPTPTATISGTTTLCQNSTAPEITFSNPLSLAVTVTYNINGGSDKTINVSAGSSASVTAPTNTAGTFDYNLVSVNYQSAPGCSNNLSGSATVTVNALPSPTLTSSDADNIFCSGTNVTFTASGGTNYNFRVSGTSVQNSSTPTYSTSTLANGQVVDVIVTNANGCTATSSGIINFVNPLPLIFISTPASCSVDLATYSLAVTVGSGTVTSTAGTVTYTGSNVWSVTNVPSGTNITLTVTDSYSCQNFLVVNAPDCSCPVVVAPVSGGDKSYCASGTIPTISASVQAGETVDWYNSSSGGTLLRSSSLTYTPTGPGTFYATARNITTGCVSSTRTAITVTMNPLPVPTLTSSDADNIFCSGTGVTFTAGGGTNYNFRVSGLSVQNGISPTYTTSTLSDGQVVDVIVTNSNGCVASSAGITNTVNPLPVPTLVSSDPDNKICIGTSVTFTAGGGTNYNFRIGGSTVQNGSSTTYTTSSLVNGQVVDVIVTNANGCVATSSGITNTVNPLPTPTLTSSDADNTFCLGTSVTFTAGGGTTYNFRVNGVSVQSGASSTYTTTSLTNGQVVDVIVTNVNGCTAVSSGITNTVLPLPVTVLISSDADNQFCAGTSVTFTGGGGINYNFRVAGASVQNSASPTYTTSILTNGQVVDVIVTDANGCSATSAGITNTVNALPVPTLTSSDADNIFCEGSTITFTAGGGTNYNFKVSGVSMQSGSSTTYTTSSLTNGQVVNVVVTNASGCTATSAGLTNFVNPLPLIFITTPPTCSADLTKYSLQVTVSSGTVTSTAGTVTNTSGNIWSIADVPSGTNITLTVTDLSGCQNSIVLSSPNCSCPVIQSPVSGGDKSYCESGVVPTISATVNTGETVDWYSAPSGGTLLKSSSLNYMPSGPGTYYAMARNTTTGCVSSLRTPITVTMNPLPVPTLTSSDTDNKFCTGTSITFTAGGGTNYNFRINGLSVQNGVTSTYTTSSLTNGQAVDVVVTNASGCAATSAGITNTVYNLPSPALVSSDADNTFCAGTSITFTGGGGTNYNFRIGGLSVQNSSSAAYTTSSLTNGQVIDVIVTNANGCSATSGEITNTVFAVPSPVLTSSDPDNTFCTGTTVTFTASGGTNYNFRINNSSVQNSTADTYTTSSLSNGNKVDVIVTNNNGCSATSAALTNTVNPYPAANPGNGGNECDLDFTLNAIPSIGTGTWSLASGPGTATFIPDTHTANALVAVSQYGTYTFTWTEISNGCSKSSNISVNFYQPPVANAGTGGNNCGPEFIFNAVPSIGTGTWTLTSGPGTVTFTPDAHQPDAKGTVSAYGNYTFRWTEVNGTCQSSSTVNVSFFAVPAANAGEGGSECDLDFQLNAILGVGVGTWTKFSGPGNAVFSPDANHPDALVTVDQYGTYEFAWTEVNSTCQSTDRVTVVFHSLPTVFAGKDTVICMGESVQLEAQGTGSFEWDHPEVLSDSSLSNPVASPMEATDFIVTLTDQYGCENTDTVMVDVWEQPVAFAGNDTTLQYLFSTGLEGGELKLHETGTWSVIEGTGIFSDPADHAAEVTGLSLGENILNWTVTNDVCPVSNDYLVITVNNLVIPTLITPNGDPYNEYFILRGIETLGKTELTIFDRRGLQVYKNSNYDNSWNGLDYNGNPLPDDTYFYVLRSQNGKSLSGYIVIRR